MDVYPNRDVAGVVRTRSSLNIGRLCQDPARDARDATRRGCLGARVRWRRSLLLRQRPEREGESGPPARATLRGEGMRRRDHVTTHKVVKHDEWLRARKRHLAKKHDSMAA